MADFIVLSTLWTFTAPPNATSADAASALSFFWLVKTPTRAILETWSFTSLASLLSNSPLFNVAPFFENFTLALPALRFTLFADTFEEFLIFAEVSPVIFWTFTAPFIDTWLDFPPIVATFK